MTKNQDSNTDCNINIPVNEIFTKCSILLQKNGSPLKTSSIVIKDLIINEIQGYSSHGLLRLIDYIDDIKKGKINPKNKPHCTSASSCSTIIYGNNSFGSLIASYLSNQLLIHLKKTGFGFVSLINNTSHIGRLHTIASKVSRKGGIVIGFCNYSEQNQKVVPFKSFNSKLGTNPLVLSAPFHKGYPIVLDISTSTVAEGKIRCAYLQGKKVPEGWLVDKSWEFVTDPNRFYSDPPSAFLCPLGGKDHGYKGFGLSLFVEILAGVLTGGEFSRRTTTLSGNSAFFLVISPRIMGLEKKHFYSRLRELISYIQDSQVNNTSNNVLIPGWRAEEESAKFKKDEIINIPTKVWENIEYLLSLHT